MTKPIPVVRAAAIGPLAAWMRMERRPLDRVLSELGLEYLATEDPLKPVPLNGVVRLLNRLTQDEGADFPSRVIQETSDIALAMMGPFAMAAGTPRDAFDSVTQMLPYFSSHEHFVLVPNASGGIVREFWANGFEQESTHNLCQWVAALVELFVSQTVGPAPQIDRICMPLHPEHGLDILKARFKAPLEVGPKGLAIHIPHATLDATFRSGTTPAPLPNMPPLSPLRGISLANTTRIVIRALLETGTPKVQDVAETAGLPVRTFQRSLTKEGTSFSALLGEVRREAAIDWMQSSEQHLSELSVRLGYASPSALTRSVRRWTGNSPSEYRAQSGRAM